MSAVTHRPLDTAVVAAQDREDVVVGNVIVRHRRASRLIHWTVSVLFFVCLFTGMPIWTPIFGWMAALFGGLSVCRVLHPWTGVAFFLSMAVMFFHWLPDMHSSPSQKRWSLADARRYMRYETDESDTGKYNGGQIAFFYAVALGAVGLLLVFHIYLGTAAEPGTFGSMIRGTVTRPWARLHHGRWYRQVTGDASEDSRRR